KRRCAPADWRSRPRPERRRPFVLRSPGPRDRSRPGCAPTRRACCPAGNRDDNAPRCPGPAGLGRGRRWGLISGSALTCLALGGETIGRLEAAADERLAAALYRNFVNLSDTARMSARLTPLSRRRERIA